MAALTALSVATYKPKDKRREIRDPGTAGLVLVIQSKKTGTRSWVLRFRDLRGKSAKLTLGRVDLTPDANLPSKRPDPVVGAPLTLGDARQLAGKLMAERARGADLVSIYAGKNRRKAIANDEAGSFSALAVEFFRTYKTKRSHERPRRWRINARLLGLAWKPNDDPVQKDPEVLPGSLCDQWGKRPVAQITRREIEDVVEDAKAKRIPGLKAKNKDVSENRGRKLFAILSEYFSWLAKRRHVDVDPTVSIEAPHAPKARTRILTADEMRWVWLAAGELPGSHVHGPIVKMLLLTGQRLNEVGGMCRSELSEDASLWTIPPQRTKNHQKHLLPLPVLAREIIGGMMRIEGSDLVFTVTGNPPSGWSIAKTALDAAVAAIAKKERGKDVEIAGWVLHDLRRTFASGLQHIGVAPQVIERALNHFSGTFAGVAGIYQRDPLTDDVRAALSSWSRYLQMVTDTKLHAAHHKLLHQGEDDERARNLQHFRDCVRAGGDHWQSYIDALTGKKPAKLADLTSERRRRSK